MSNTHVDLISPDEIVDFIKKQNVSEEKATGIKLLRRSAETIAYLQDKIAIFEDGQHIKNVNDGADLDSLEQIALALGIEDHSLDSVLEHIESMHNERNIHIAGIAQRDAVIEQTEEQIIRLQNTPIKVSPAPDHTVLQEATKFGYALIGFSYENKLPDRIIDGAQGIIDYSEQK